MFEITRAELYYAFSFFLENLRPLKERDRGYEFVEQQQNQIQQLTESVAYYEQFRPSVQALCESYSALEVENINQRETIEGQRMMKEVYDNNIET